MTNVVTSPETMLRLILNSRVYDVAQETPLEPRRAAVAAAAATRSC